jgi:two-component system, chemotaxis family, chemotaxis protein CheY
MGSVAVSQGTCLVVDDSAVVRKVARRILERHGFTVREAADGQQALEACRAELPRAVLLDRNMPVLDGVGFLRALRREYGPDDPVVLFCTSEAGHSQILEGIEAGAQEYLMKPFDDDILHDKLVQAGLLPA